MRIEWSDAYKIGNAAIDAQHETWFERINNFLTAPDGDSLTQCEMLMHQYTRDHFQHEESLMRAVNYPAVDDHLSQHKKLLIYLSEISQQIANDSLDRVVLKKFLSNWLLSHIRVHDTKLANYVIFNSAKKSPAG